MRRRVRRILAGSVAALTAAVVALVLLHPGVVTTEVDLHDGGVWVINGEMRLAAHLNYPSQALDSSLRTASATSDVDQAGNSVFISDPEADTYTQVDVARTVLLTPASAAGSAQMELGHDRVGVADPQNGSVWVMPVEEYATFNPESQTPVVTDLPGAVLAMGTDGSVHVASAQAGQVHTLTRAGVLDDAEVTALPDLGEQVDLQVTAVGDRTAVLDRASGTLVLPGGATAAIEGEDLQLQIPGPAAQEVLVASTTALMRVSLDGEVTQVVPTVTGGRPSRPAQHAGCAYAAWSGQGATVRDCASKKDDVNAAVDSLASASEAVFRVNRDVIVLNDIASGGLWLPDKNMIQVDNWEDVNSDVEKEEESEEETVETEETDQQRNEENTPPEAVDDAFGVRPGRSAFLPVIANDTDPDGDVLVASPSSQPDFGEVVAVRNGGALQVNVDDGASGSSTFEYLLDDGAAQDTAIVTLNVHPFDVNGGPEQLRTSSLVLASGATGVLNVSGDWLDPDGDPIYLKGVSFPEGLDVTWRADGTITVKDLARLSGIHELTVTYSDGAADTDGVLRVDLRGDDNLVPVANGDHVVTQVGTAVQVQPLLNDTDGNGDVLRLVSLGDAHGTVTASVDVNMGVVTLTPSQVGTTYITYMVSDGPATAEGVIRMDAIEAGAEVRPVAMDDVTTLPAGGQTLVSVLDNDTDPAGGVLTVQSVRTADGSPLVVALLEHHLLRVTAPSGLDRIETVTYTVANASGTAEGRVTVIPVPAAAASQPPELFDDTLVVRAGDVGSISVLKNDRSPAGLTMTVSNELQHEIPEAMGQPFVSDSVVRFRAGTQAGSGKIIYTVYDTAGNVASATVNLTVVAPDHERNTAPHPVNVTGWAVAGETVEIAIPLEGIDSEGDSVTLVGLTSSPTLGTVEVSPTYLTYTASQTSAGTDVFAYTVRDRLGMTATATVRVGVVQAAASNQKPVALADLVTVKPGVRISVPVVANDVDPDGDTLSLVGDMVLSAHEAVTARATGSRVVLTAPKTSATFTVQYGVTDSHSDPVTGLLTVVVTPEAPSVAPIARDDLVTAADAASKRSVEVSVLDNDEDPDGDILSASVTSSDPGVSVGRNGVLSIQVQEDERYVLYTVTDADGLMASAVVYVPGSQVSGPQLDRTKSPPTVRAGESIDIAINDYVVTRPGRSVRITDGNKASASVGWDGSALVKDDTTVSFGAAADYSGPSSVTFEVTDGADLHDSDGIVTYLTLPITVTPGDNRPPILKPTAVEVVAGEAAVTADASQWVSDPDGESSTSMRYEVSDAPSGVTASLSGHTLSVSADASTPKGAAGHLTLTVTDSSGAQVSAQVPVTVVTSVRERIQVSAATVTADAGKPVTVDLAAYATNPFPGSPLYISGTPSADDGASIRVSGTTVTITPPAGTNGTSTVTYKLGDKTRDPEREVQGTVSVTVRDKPDAPFAVRASSNSASTASVSWSAGAANGAPITGFTLYDTTQGDSIDCGAVTTCLMTGRKNGSDHTFHVVAHNEVGDSPASASATTNIDVVPGTVPQATVTPGDRQIVATWAPPSNEGSTITRYTVALSPGGQQQQVSGTSATFSNLTNGTAYTVVVKAENSKGASDQWSTASVAAVPYGQPGPVGSVSAAAANLGAAGSSDSVTVTWSPVSNTNGRSIEYYTVTWPGGSSVVPGGNSTSTTVGPVATSDQKVTFTVTATNDAASPGAHTSTGVSTSTWVVGRPKAPTASGLKATGADRTIALSASAVGGNGWSASDLTLEWSVAGGTWQSTTNLTGNGLANGTSTTVYVRACGSKTGTVACSEPTNAGTVSPFAPPVAPSVRCQPGAIGWVDCYWEGAGTGGRPTKLTLTGSTNETIDLKGNGHRAFNVGEGGSASLCVKAVQTTSEAGTVTRDGGCASATAPSYPRHYQGYQGTPSNCVGANCGGSQHYVNGIELSGWPPNSRVTCSGVFDGRQSSTTVAVNGDGYYRGEPKWSPLNQTLVQVSGGHINWTWFTCRN